MADENPIDGSTSTATEVTGESSESDVELNIKTLDSQIYTLRVNKNIPVPLFKEIIANKIGIPVEQQRLICRGKVLKDDHLLSEYHVEDGHTLHLVERQPSRSQALPGTNSGESSGSNDNRASDATAGAPRNRVGQVSHSVVLGTFNVGEQGEGVVPDLNRIIGAVLNSIGIGNQTTTGGVNNIPSNVSASQGVGTEGSRASVGGRSQAGNQAQPVQTVSSPFHNLLHSLQIPPTGTSMPVPSVHAPIPDSFSTLSEFINRMELAFSANGYQPNPSPTNIEDSSRGELPSNARGLPTPETLSFIMRRAQQLLSGYAATSLSHIAGRLEREGASTDPEVRGQIQTESVQVGLAMQHLGALLLELGRTILTLRMGQTPAESLVNAGPAVYISPSGPNPIMVQPFPLQTSSLFGGASTAPQTSFGTPGPIGLGDASRNINIHIHAGTAIAPALSLVGSRANTVEGTRGDHPNGTGSVDSGPPRVPVRNIIAAAVPSRSAAEATSHVLNSLYPLHARSNQSNPHRSIPAEGSSAAVSGAAQSDIVSAPHAPSEHASLPTVIAELNTQIRNLVDNINRETLAPSGLSDSSTVQDPSLISGINVAGAGETYVPLPDLVSETEGQQPQPECPQSTDNEDTSDSLKSKEASSTNSIEGSSNSPSGGTILSCQSKIASEDASRSNQSHNPPEGAKTVPLGLGLGGLQPRKRSKQVKLQGKVGGETSVSRTANENKSTIASGQRVLQSVLSRGANENRTAASSPTTGHVLPLPEQLMETTPLGGQGLNGQFDPASMMSQVLNSPAINGLLAGVSEQAGVGSPAVLRNMLQQFTQSPSMRNTINQIAQQVQDQDLGSMLSGLGRGQGGGIDLSSMVQQMMPIVTQAFTRGSAHTEAFSDVEPEQQPQFNERSPNIDDKSDSLNSQIDLHQTAQRIERHNPPMDIFRSVVENAAHLYNDGTHYQDLIEELCLDEGLANEFMEMLQRHIRRRLEEDS